QRYAINSINNNITDQEKKDAENKVIIKKLDPDKVKLSKDVKITGKGALVLNQVTIQGKGTIECKGNCYIENSIISVPKGTALVLGENAVIMDSRVDATGVKSIGENAVLMKTQCDTNTGELGVYHTKTKQVKNLKAFNCPANSALAGTVSKDGSVVEANLIFYDVQARDITLKEFFAGGAVKDELVENKRYKF
ncbi:hypothetical protein ACFL4O_01155, partial [bacterium]